jgi:hypothetical protein
MAWKGLRTKAVKLLH